MVLDEQITRRDFFRKSSEIGGAIAIGVSIPLLWRYFPLLWRYFNPNGEDGTPTQANAASEMTCTPEELFNELEVILDRHLYPVPYGDASANRFIETALKYSKEAERIHDPGYTFQYRSRKDVLCAGAKNALARKLLEEVRNLAPDSMDDPADNERVLGMLYKLDLYPDFVAASLLWKRHRAPITIDYYDLFRLTISGATFLSESEGGNPETATYQILFDAQSSDGVQNFQRYAPIRLRDFVDTLPSPRRQSPIIEPDEKQNPGTEEKKPNGDVLLPLGPPA